MNPGDNFTKFRIDNLCTDTRATRRSHRDREIAVIAHEQRRSEKLRVHFRLAGLIDVDRALGRVGDRDGIVEEHHDPVARELVERALVFGDERPQRAGFS